MINGNDKSNCKAGNNETLRIWDSGEDNPSHDFIRRVEWAGRGSVDLRSSTPQCVRNSAPYLLTVREINVTSASCLLSVESIIQ